jgi:hypothetical protein
VHALATGPNYDSVVELVLDIGDDLRVLAEVVEAEGVT